MSIEVRCSCGQMVYPDAGQAGKNVQCPHCKGVVAVPVATASAAPPDPAQDRKNEATAAIIVGVVVLIGLWFFADAFAPSFVKWLGMGAAVAILGALGAFGGRR